MKRLIDYEAIKTAVPMQAVLDYYGIAVTRRGVAVCPFHADKHPSMKVYMDGYYCFSCGAGGDAINFVSRKESVTNHEAAAIVAKIGGMELAENDYRSRAKMRKIAIEKRNAERERSQLEQRYDELCKELRRLRNAFFDNEPFSDEWCAACMKIPQTEGELDGIFEKLAEV